MGRLHEQGTAIVGGDVSGNTRGTYSIDIQATRSAVTEVASAVDSIALGRQNTVGNVGQGIAIGKNNTISAAYSDLFAIGTDNTLSNYADESVAIGKNNSSTAARATAIGHDNRAGTAAHSYSVAIGHNNDALATAALATGYNNTASGGYSTALGSSNTVAGYQATGIGFTNTVAGYYALGVGFTCIASAYFSTALGYQAEARIEKTTNICGPQITRKDDGEAAGSAFESFCGVEVVLMTKEVDLKVVADHTLTLPTNCKFWFDEMGLIATDIDTLTVQPTIRFGITGTPAKQNAAAITTAITAAGKREVEQPLVPEDGETSLVGGITVAATATTAKGRFYFRGLLVEDE